MIKIIKNTFLNPLKEFLHDSKSIGIILLICTCISLIIANISSINITYHNFWEQTFDKTNNHKMHVGLLSLPNSLIYIINDFLMAFFFFLAGMEIKREFVEGELSSFKNSILPIAAAIGGIILPAIIFVIINYNQQFFLKGWAIPTATDIAFTLGIASLLGKRVPFALKVFITALAIIDDLGAILLIALFYGGTIDFIYVLATVIIIILLVFINKFTSKFGIIQIILGFVLWYCIFNSGIHATVAGVLFAFTIPKKYLASFELKIHPIVYFIILPLFALANTAITFPNNFSSIYHSTLSVGIIMALVVGKPLGIWLASFIMIKTKLAVLPRKTNWQQLIGASILCGIGFTMSIFIAMLAFADAESRNIAKIAVLLGSLTAMIIGFYWLKKASFQKQKI